MKGGPKSSLRPFLHRALQLYSHVVPKIDFIMLIHTFVSEV